MSQTSVRTLHLNISFVINHDNWGWSDPKVHKSMDFQIPLALFSAKEFTKFVEDHVLSMDKEFPEAVIAHEKAEAEKKAKEEAEKLAEVSA